MTHPPLLPQQGKHHLRFPAHNVEFLLGVQLAVVGREVGLAFEEEAPPVGAHGHAEDVVGVPGPEGDEDAGVQGEDGVEGRGVVQAEVRAVPVDYAGAGGGGRGGCRSGDDRSGSARHGLLLEIVDRIFWKSQVAIR